MLYRVESTDFGWNTTNGTVFTMSNIGYDLEASDEVYVIAHS